MRKETN
ncbi:hypothetical protein MTR67_011952 [Solanum verrucosum]|nr:hypothetical protein MTR67_011952 [Solanum verrucosum]